MKVENVFDNIPDEEEDFVGMVYQKPQESIGCNVLICHVAVPVSGDALISVTSHKCLVQQACQSASGRIWDDEPAVKRRANVKDFE